MIVLFCLIVALLSGIVWLIVTAPLPATHCNKCGTELLAVPERYGLQMNSVMILECPICKPVGNTCLEGK